MFIQNMFDFFDDHSDFAIDSGAQNRELVIDITMRTLLLEKVSID